jgi:Cys-rich protein (TIGR01571 family)
VGAGLRLGKCISFQAHLTHDGSLRHQSTAGLCAYFCTLCMAGSVAEKSSGSFCVDCCLPILAPIHCCLWGNTRTRIRTRYGIPGDGCTDCMAHLFCCCCALVQEAREIEMRGGEVAFKAGFGPGAGASTVVMMTMPQPGFHR